MINYLLGTDLDDTLLGNDEAINRFELFFHQLKTSRNIKLAYVTGRSLASFNELIKEKHLPTPNALVTALGTEIYIDGQHIASRPTVEGWSRDAITDTLKEFSALQLQPDSEQREYKISYYIDDGEKVVDEMRKRLQEYPVHISYSMNHYLDILPNGVNKGSALQFLSSRWHVDEANIFCAGDSLNDVDMLKVGNAIVVGNAKDELTSWAQAWDGSVYIAENNYADAIIEGLKHFGLSD